jgi:hypothetical protein
MKDNGAEIEGPLSNDLCACGKTPFQNISAGLALNQGRGPNTTKMI